VLTHLVVTPAILYWVFWAPRYLRLPFKKQFPEGGLLAVGLILTGYMAFNTESVRIGLAEARFYAPVPFLFWAAIRFGMFGASGAVMIIAVLAIEAALEGREPFAGQSPADVSLALQFYLLLRAAPLHVVAILIDESKRSGVEAQRQRAEVAHATRMSAMGSLAGSLAHELNQPLTAI
jgi:integral membrane sensor domain MASE1